MPVDVDEVSVSVTVTVYADPTAALFTPELTAAACAITLIDFSTGGEFCGRYARVTLCTAGVWPLPPAISSFHWM